MRRRYFQELEGFKRAIDNLPPSDPLTRELFAKDDDMRKENARLKRARKMQRNLRNRKP